MKLSPHFSYAEMVRTSIKRDNTPTRAELVNLVRLCIYILEPARVSYGKPIYINSGYRSYFVNQAVGGVPNSAHCDGRAADLRVENNEQGKALFDILKENPWVDQLLYEHKGRSRWIHVAWSENPRHIINNNYAAN